MKEQTAKRRWPLLIAAVAAGILLLVSTVGGARAALTIKSDEEAESVDDQAQKEEIPAEGAVASGKFKDVKSSDWYGKYADKAAEYGLMTGYAAGKDANGNNTMYRLGHFFFVINPDFFMGGDVFRKTAGDICRGLRASEKAPGQERIYTAGEKEWIAWQERKDKGVPVGESLQKEFTALRDELGLPYRFDFEKQ